MRELTEGERMRERILDAVDVLLARHGYDNMTVDDLAEELSVGRGTIYLYFRGKEDIALSHLDRSVDQLLEQLRIIARSRDSVVSRLRAILTTRILFRYDCVQHYTDSLNDWMVSLRPTYLARRQRHFEEEARILASVLEEGHESGVLSVLGDPASTARTLVLATNSLLPHDLRPRELRDRKGLEERIEKVADLLLNGLFRRYGAVHRGRESKEPKTAGQLVGL